MYLLNSFILSLLIVFLNNQMCIITDYTMATAQRINIQDATVFY